LKGWRSRFFADSQRARRCKIVPLHGPRFAMTPPTRSPGFGIVGSPDAVRAHRRPRQYFGGARQLPALVADGCIDMGLLASFDFLMRRHGQAVCVHRMRYDRAYALERLALGHRRDDAALRQLVLLLFDIYVGEAPAGD
jgi:hypothetical protein